MISKEKTKQFYNAVAHKRVKVKRKNWYYHQYLEKQYAFMIPENSKVLEVGCGTGELLHAVKPAVGVGIDFAENMTEKARQLFPDLQFYALDVDVMELNDTFDYVIISDVLHILYDIQGALKNIRAHCHNGTKIIISNYNYLWEPVLRLSEKLHLKQSTPISNWLSHNDIYNLLEIEGFQVVKTERKILLPKYIPVLSYLFNRILVNLPFFNLFGLVNFIVARPYVYKTTDDYSVSIVVPARNEKGNIENAVIRTPQFGLKQEFIFVEGNSSDQTYEEMLRVTAAYPEKDIKVFRQSGRGKGNAVREGFEKATGDILMILDADLTTPPEDMPKFYNALASGKGEFINGCRLVYPMEKQAMRFLNLLGNKFFSWFFSYLLGQRLKDTLCGTKVMFRKDYEHIVKNRHYFGDFDPFGDFDLLFGAARLNLKIIEVIVRYRDREYGSTQISRFSHGWLLIKMSLFAAAKIKFI
ncbi:MAG: glycosyltransferase [Bacteroidales bacterium]|nr:glycosyltransferase [Bacteroidales bacterium]MBN2764266.1 glycosyltransferase [Bacteroidales bacterium]